MQHVIQPPRGSYRIFLVDERQRRRYRFLFERANQIQYSWAILAVQAIGRGQGNYKINGMYVEYENVASPSDPVSVPSFDRSEGLEYYTGLAGDRDYLRVPLLAEPALAVASGYEDFFSGTGVEFNQATFLAQTSGVFGARGEPFGAASNSKVCGIALIAAPSWDDSTQDIIFGRSYFDTDEQILKQDGFQVGISWRQIFG